MRAWLPAVAALFVSATAVAQDPTQRGVSFLLQSQGANGAFGVSTGEDDVVATHEALEALRAVGMSSSAEADNARLYFATGGALIDGELRLRRSIALAGTAFALTPPEVSSHAEGFDAEDAHHLVFNLLAHRRAGTATLTEARRLAAFVPVDGCVTRADDAPSAELTADVAIALQSDSYDGQVQSALSRVASCLGTLQSVDGSFGSNEDTAAALLALSVVMPTAQTQINAARGFLIASQRTDGSWGGSVRVTSLAIQALQGAGPDWRVAEDMHGRGYLYVNDPEPAQGSTVSATLDVTNAAANGAPSINVRVTAVPVSGGVAVTIAEVTLPALNAAQRISLPLQLPTTTLMGRYTLRAVVDPDGLITELDERNNVGEASLNVRSSNDLSVSNGSIHFSPGVGGHVTASGDIRNLGVTLPIQVSVDLYKGTPGSGVKIGRAMVPAGLPMNGVSTVTFDWDATSANGPTVLTLVVDPENVLQESVETNNQAFRYYYPGSELPTDLSVAVADVSVVPVQPTILAPISISATVHNLSTTDANRVSVAATQAGVSLGRIELSLVPAGGTAVATFDAALPGTAPLVITVDPDAELNDPTRTNNSAIKSLTVRPQVDLVVDGIDPGQFWLAGGEPITVYAHVQNLSDSTVTSEVQLEDAAVQKSWSVVPVTLGPYEGRYVPFGTFTRPSDHFAALKACVDPFNKLKESNDNNNCYEFVLGGGLTELNLSMRDIAFSPVGADIGESVHATAKIHNTSDTSATANVEWWQGRPDQPGSKLVAVTPVSVANGGTAVAALDWVRAEGPPELYPTLAEVTPRDSNRTNNSAGRHLFLDSVIDLVPPVSGSTQIYGREIRSGFVTGATTPDVVIGYEENDQLNNGKYSCGVELVRRNTDGSYSLVWDQKFTAERGTFLGGVSLADLDGDGSAEVIADVWYANASGGIDRHLIAYRPDATVKWETVLDVPSDHTGIGTAGNSARVGLGDVDGDGVADVVTSDSRVRALSGADGHVILNVNAEASAPYGCSFNLFGSSADVLDVDGDGALEIVGANGVSCMYRIDLPGTVRWVTASPWQSVSLPAIGDVDGDGKADAIVQAGTFAQPYFFAALFPQVGWNLTTGQLFYRYSNLNSSAIGPTIAPARQDGLPYISFGGTNDSPSKLNTVRGDLSTLYSVARPELAYPFSPLALTAADLMGRGRPQLITAACDQALQMFDSRDGKLVMQASSTIANGRGPAYDCIFADGSDGNFGAQNPVIVDLTGTGRTGVIFKHHDGYQTASPYGHAEAVIFASPHWKKQPATWAERVLVKGRITDDLKVHDHFRWWTDHNTWNDQFDQVPAKLLADLTLAAADVTSSPVQPAVGGSTTLSAVVHNVGGVSASDVVVRFYDGDPESGGVLIGDATVAGPLVPRTGSATATLSWTAYPEGQHRIFVVANPSGAIEESGTENNRTSARLFVEPASTACDLAIVVSSLGSNPSAPLAGDALTLSASVLNAGTSNCAATDVTVFDGPDGTGALTFGTAVLPALATGESATVTITAPVAVGSHQYRIVADSAGAALDADRSNNVATWPVYAASGTQPDLAVSALTFNPANPYAGEPFHVGAVVMNRGADAPESVAQVSVGGVARESLVVPPLRPGEVWNVDFGITAPSADATVAVTLDPAGSLAEFDELNNSASATLHVAASSVALSVSATPSSAGPDVPVDIAVTTANSGSATRSLKLDVAVTGPGGSSTEQLVSGSAFSVAGGATGILHVTWNTGRRTPGVYQVIATLIEGGRYLSASQTAVTVSAEADAVTSIVADRGVYHPGAEVLLRQRASNNSRNETLTGAWVVVNVADPSGAVLYSSTRPIPALIPSGAFSTADLFTVSDHLAAGSYVAASKLYSAEGIVLSTAVTTFNVEISASDVVTGSASASSPFAIGAPLPVSAALQNSGTAAATGLLDALLLDAVTLQSEASASATVTVGAGASVTQALSLPTSAVTEGQKLLVLRLDGKVLERTMIVAAANVDHDPPIISVSGVEDHQVANGDVTPIITVTDQSAFSYVATVDGVSFTSGTAITGEGEHLLIIQAMDAFGNASELRIAFTIDVTPPALVLSGISENAVVSGSVHLSYTVTDGHPGTSSSTVDGVAVTNPADLTAEGDHVWTVTSTDAAGNSATTTRSFAIDRTAPTVTLIGVADEAFYSAAISPTYSATDAHPGSITASLDGDAFASGAAITAEGAHSLVVTATDAAGNSAQSAVSFTLDFTAPVIVVSGVGEGAVVHGPISLSFSATDAALDTVVATLDGATFVSGTAVSSEGAHVLHVHSVDKAGNAGEADRHFVIDTVAPVVSVSGVAANGLYNSARTISFSATDDHSPSVSATLDGRSFSSGDVIGTNGDHLLVITAVDAAGNVSTQSLPFAIETTPPAVTIAGVSEGAYVSGAVTLSWSATDSHPGVLSATLDGASVTSPYVVSSEGAHLLTVVATDGAGNTSTVTRSFTIDVTLPTVDITGVTAGLLTGSPVTVSFSASDANLASLVATLDGLAFTSGDTVSTAGDHSLVVTAVDRAGNTTVRTIPFSIDTVAPIITISGVAQGGFAIGPVTLSWTVTEAHPGSTSGTLDGAAFTSGGVVAGEGAHTLVVTSTDAAGNSATTSRSFTIDLTTPVLTITGVTDGQVTNHLLTIGYSATDANLLGTSATLDGAAFTSGSVVSAEGSHALHVTATDKAGNQTTRELVFSVDTTPPTITISGVASGAYVNGAVSVSWAVSDAHPGSVSATLDGVNTTSPVTVSSQGAHTVVVTSTDAAGNTSSASRSFTVDTTPPVLTVSGVTEGATSDRFTITFSATDANMGSASATLDGSSFASGSTVSSPGAHTLIATATDRAGNVTARTIHFTVVPLQPAFHFAACAFGNLTIRDSAVVNGVSGKGSVAANGTALVRDLANIDGDLVSGGNLSMQNSGTVTGTAYYGGTLTLLNSPQMGGSQQVTPAPSPCECGYDLAARLADAAAHNDNGLLTSDPSIASHLSNGALTATSGTITLPAGRFHLTSLSLSNSSILNTSGAVELYVDGSVNVQNASSLGGTLLIVTGASATQAQTVTFRNDSSTAAQLYAPNADVTLQDSTTVLGAVVGRNVTLKNQQHLTFAPGTQAVPPPLTCP